MLKPAGRRNCHWLYESEHILRGNENKGTTAPAVKQKKEKLALTGKKKEPDKATEEKSSSL